MKFAVWETERQIHMHTQMTIRIHDSSYYLEWSRYFYFLMYFCMNIFIRKKSCECFGNMKRKPENDPKMTDFIYTCVQIHVYIYKE